MIPTGQSQTVQCGNSSSATWSQYKLRNLIAKLAKFLTKWKQALKINRDTKSSLGPLCLWQCFVKCFFGPACKYGRPSEIPGWGGEPFLATLITETLHSLLEPEATDIPNTPWWHPPSSYIDSLRWQMKQIMHRIITTKFVIFLDYGIRHSAVSWVSELCFLRFMYQWMGSLLCIVLYWRIVKSWKHSPKPKT